MIHRHQHSAARPGHGEPIATDGRLIRWARFYDPLVSLLTLGRGRALRTATVEIAARGGPPLAGATVLEVGCGTAELALAAARRGATVYGIDPSPDMIAVARAKAERMLPGRLDLRVGAIEGLPFADGTFDIVLSSLMLHHLPAEVKRRGLPEVRRVLKPGGRFVAIDFRRPSSFGQRLGQRLMLHGGQADGIEAVPALLAEAGFATIDMPISPFRTLGFVVATVGS